MHFSLLIKNLEKVWGTPLKKMEKTIIIQNTDTVKTYGRLDERPSVDKPNLIGIAVVW